MKTNSASGLERNACLLVRVGFIEVLSIQSGRLISAPTATRANFCGQSQEQKKAEGDLARTPLLEGSIRCDRAERRTLRLDGRSTKDPQLAAHFTKERSSKTTAQGDFGVVHKLHDVVPMKERMQTPHRSLSHQGRPVGPYEFPWVELIFEALNRLPQNVRSSRCVNNDIFVGCLNPDNFVHGHEEDAFVIFNREPGEPWTAEGGWDRGVQSPNRSLDRCREALLIEWLAEVVNGLDFEGSHCIFAVTRYEDKERRFGSGSLIT